MGAGAIYCTLPESLKSTKLQQLQYDNDLGRTYSFNENPEIAHLLIDKNYE